MQVSLTMFTPEQAISDNAKICYGTTSSKDITKSIVHSHKHLASLRFAYATVHIEGISVACQNQIVRSSHLDFMVQSKRYVDAKKGGFTFIMPQGLTESVQTCMKTHWDSAIVLYNKLLDDGVRKEDARAVLPANTSTAMNMTGNLQGFWSFLKLRLSKHAQTEVREVALAVYNLLAEKYPQVFTKEVLNKFQSQ